MKIVKVRQYEDYCVVWYEDGSKKTFADWMAPPAVEDFKEFCHEKGIIKQVGQAVEYSVDPNFRTL